MSNLKRINALFLTVCILAATVLPIGVSAAFVDDYAGTPYFGTAPVIPADGTESDEIRFIDYDNGGVNVACGTNPGGTYYNASSGRPLGTMPHNITHFPLYYPGTWANYTVNVEEAGTYVMRAYYIIVGGNESYYVKVNGKNVSNYDGVSAEHGSVKTIPTVSGVGKDGYPLAVLELEEGENVITYGTTTAVQHEFYQHYFTLQKVQKNTPYWSDYTMKKDTPYYLVSHRFDIGGAYDAETNPDGAFSFRYTGPNRFRCEADTVEAYPDNTNHIVMYSGDFVRYTINAENAGWYDVTVNSYSSGESPTVAVQVEGGVQGARRITANIPANTPSKTIGQFYLREGENVIRVENTEGTFIWENVMLSWSSEQPIVYDDAPDVIPSVPGRAFVYQYESYGVPIPLPNNEDYKTEDNLGITNIDDTYGMDMYKGRWIEYRVNVSAPGKYALWTLAEPVGSELASAVIYVDGERQSSGTFYNEGNGCEKKFLTMINFDSAGEHLVRYACEEEVQHRFCGFWVEDAVELTYDGARAVAEYGTTELTEDGINEIEYNTQYFEVTASNKIDKDALENVAVLTDSEGKTVATKLTAEDKVLKVALDGVLKPFSEYTLTVSGLKDIFQNELEGEFVYALKTKTDEVQPAVELNVPGTILVYQYDRGGLYDENKNPNGSYYMVGEEVANTEVYTDVELANGYRPGDKLSIIKPDEFYRAFLEKNEWLQYTVNVQDSGEYAVWAGAAFNEGWTSNGTIYVDGVEKISKSLSGEGGDVYLGTVVLTEGKHKIKYAANASSGHVFRYLKFEKNPDMVFNGVYAASDKAEFELSETETVTVDNDVDEFAIELGCDAATDVETDCIKLKDASGTEIELKISVSGDRIIASVEAALKASSEYVLEIPAGKIRDMYGNVLNSKKVYTFKTSGGDVEIISLENNGLVTDAIVKNNTYSSKKTATLISATVSGNKTNAVAISGNMEIAARNSGQVSVTRASAEGTIRNYIWDSIYTMHPIYGAESAKGFTAFKPGTAYIDYTNGTLVVKGVAKGDGAVTLLITRPGKTIVDIENDSAAFDTVLYAGEPQIKADTTFEEVVSLEDADLGDYTVYVCGSGVFEPLQQTVTYYDINDVKNAVIEIKERGFEAAFMDSELEVAEKLNLKHELYATVDHDALYEALDDRKSELDENDTGSVKKLFEETLVMLLLDDAGDDEIIEVFDKYFAELELTSAELYADYAAMNDADKKAVLKLANFDKAKDAEDVRDILSLAVANFYINSINGSSDVEAVLEKIYKYADAEDAYENYLDLNKNQKTAADKYFADKAKTYGNKNEIATLIEKAVEAGESYTAPKTPTGGGGGGGSSFGGRDSYILGTDTTPSVEAKERFADVPKTHWAYSYVEELAKLGVVNGKTDSEFAPEAAVTREEFVKLIVCAMNIDLMADAVPFNDVKQNEWYAPYINAAYKNGIVTGISEDAFGIGETITREQMATIIYRVSKAYLENIKGEEFVDSESISDYAKDAVSVICGNGIVNGYADGRFAPQDILTRAQAAKVIKLVYDIIY